MILMVMMMGERWWQLVFTEGFLCARNLHTLSYLSLKAIPGGRYCSISISLRGSQSPEMLSHVAKANGWSAEETGFHSCLSGSKIHFSAKVLGRGTSGPCSCFESDFILILLGSSLPAWHFLFSPQLPWIKTFCPPGGSDQNQVSLSSSVELVLKTCRFP